MNDPYVDEGIQEGVHTVDNHYMHKGWFRRQPLLLQIGLLLSELIAMALIGLLIIKIDKWHWLEEDYELFDYISDNSLCWWIYCFAFFVPYILICINFFVGKVKQQRNRKKKTDPQVYEQSVIEEGAQQKADNHNLRIPLLDFAFQNGQMRIRSITSSDGTCRRFCLFDDGVEVFFSEDIGELSAEQISAEKASLYVEQDPNGSFFLKRE